MLPGYIFRLYQWKASNSNHHLLTFQVIIMFSLNIQLVIQSLHDLWNNAHQQLWLVIFIGVSVEVSWPLAIVSWPSLILSYLVMAVHFFMNLLFIMQFFFLAVECPFLLNLPIADQCPLFLWLQSQRGSLFKVFFSHYIGL